MFKKVNYLLILLLLLALCLRLPFVLKDYFPFVFDMGRDMVWVRDIVELRRPYLIGPWSSIAGVYFGPAWYYLLVIPFLLTDGDPRGSVFLVLFLNLLTIYLAFVFGKKIQGRRFGLLLAFLLTICPIMINISGFAFHANLLPLINLLFIYSLYQVLEGEKKFFMLAALMASLNFHFEPATAIFTTLTLLVFLILPLKKQKLKIRKLALTLIIFALPFTPQVIFELRHDFLQSRALLSYFKGENQSLGGRLALGPRILNRFSKFGEVFSGVVSSPKALGLLWLVVIGYLAWQLYKKEKGRIRDLIFVLGLNILVPFLGFTFLFSAELKGWYLYGLSVTYVFLLALVLDFLMRKNKDASRLFFLLLFLLFLINANPILKLKDFLDGYRLNRPEILANQKKALDWVYEDAGKQPFKVYVYTPPVYDYHYQYLIFWYGRKKFAYLPTEYSYLPGESRYLNFKEYYVNPSPQETNLVYLLIEPDEVRQRVEGWLGHFSETELEKRIKLNSGIVVEKRRE